MTFRFKLDEPVGSAVQRIGDEQLRRALGSLRNSDTLVGTHEMRKCIKRLRALLRLVRPGIDNEAYGKLNTDLRDAARLLSHDRDLDVLLATVKQLASGKGRSTVALRRLHKAITAQRSVGGNGDGQARRRQARRLLQQVREDWSGPASAIDKLTPIAQGLENGMEELAGALASCRSGGADEDYHDLRKAVQRHWRHMRLLQEGWPALFEARAQEAREISELLGRAQDLTLLSGFLERHGGDVLNSRDVAAVREQVLEMRSGCWETALARTARLLVEGSRGFARRACAYWELAEVAQEARSSLEVVASQTKAAKPRTRRSVVSRKRSGRKRAERQPQSSSR